MKAAFTVFFVLSLFRLNFSLRRHFIVTEKMTWKDAQMYCRKYHDDLSTVNKEEAQLLSGNTDFTYRLNWIGLYISPNNPEKWIWSGGEVEAIDNWDSGQPDDFAECGGLKQSTSKLHDIPCS